MTKINESALAYALKLLNYRMRTNYELAKKLEAKGFTKTIIQEVLQYCEDQRYLSDKDYAYTWVQYRCNGKPVGRWRLKSELCQKGIETAIIEAILEEVFDLETELAILKELIKDHRQSMLYLNNPERLLRFLKQRGFSFELINKAYLELGMNLPVNLPENL